VAGVPVSIASYSRGLGNLAAGVAGKWLLVDAAIAESYGMRADQILRALRVEGGG
jgi:hypothetical protein